LRKSPSENLNYALAIGQVLGAREGEGSVAARAPLRSPIMDTAQTVQIDAHFKLPLSLSDFYATWMGIIEGATERGTRQLLAHNAAHVFPNGAGSARMLHTIERSPFPAWLREENGNWVMVGSKPRSVQLDHNGFVELSGDMVRLHAPDDVGLSSLYGDSKRDMDLFLKAYALHRDIGSESVRVTSLGTARKQSTYTDSYGRIWRSRAWAIPYDDSMLTVISLPTPEGYAGIYFRAPTRYWQLAVQQEQMLLDYVFLTMEGSLSRWQSYLALKSLQPKAFESLQLEITGAQQLRFQSRRCALEVTPERSVGTGNAAAERR